MQSSTLGGGGDSKPARARRGIQRVLHYADMLQMHISIMSNKRLIIDTKRRHSICQPFTRT